MKTVDRKLIEDVILLSGADCEIALSDIGGEDCLSIVCRSERDMVLFIFTLGQLSDRSSRVVHGMVKCCTFTIFSSSAEILFPGFSVKD